METIFNDTTWSDLWGILGYTSLQGVLITVAFVATFAILWIGLFTTIDKIMHSTTFRKICAKTVTLGKTFLNLFPNGLKRLVLLLKTPYRRYALGKEVERIKKLKEEERSRRKFYNIELYKF